MRETIMEPYIPYLVTIVCSVVASSGFWAWIQKRGSNKDATSKLLMGLAYDKITTLGLQYISRGWITKDEFEDYRRYFYEPYKEFGGNGVAERIMNEVTLLPLRPNVTYNDIFQAKMASGKDG